MSASFGDNGRDGRKKQLSPNMILLLVGIFVILPMSGLFGLLWTAVAAVLLVGWLTGCGASVGPSRSLAAGSAKTDSVPSARVGRSGQTERVPFVPEMVVLPGGARAVVKPASWSRSAYRPVTCSLTPVNGPVRTIARSPVERRRTPVRVRPSLSKVTRSVTSRH